MMVMVLNLWTEVRVRKKKRELKKKKKGLHGARKLYVPYGGDNVIWTRARGNMYTV